MAQGRAVVQEGEKAGARCRAFMAPIGVFAALVGVNQREQFTGFLRCKAVVTLLRLQAIQELPAINPVVQVESVTTAATPNAERLLIIFLGGNG